MGNKRTAALSCLRLCVSNEECFTDGAHYALCAQGEMVGRG